MGSGMATMPPASERPLPGQRSERESSAATGAGVLRHLVLKPAGHQMNAVIVLAILQLPTWFYVVTGGVFLSAAAAAVTASVLARRQ